MNKKIKDAFSNIKISSKREDKILEKTIYKNTNKVFKLSYVFLVMTVLLVSISIVYAKDISNFIKKWGGIDRIFKNGEVVKEEEKESITTNIDDLVLERNNEYDEWMTLSEVEEYLGIDVLTINRERTAKDTELILWNYIADYNDGKVQAITIRQVDFIPKEISLHAKLITKNFPSEFVEAFNEDTGVSYEALEYVETITLDNLNVEATIYSFPLWDYEKDEKDKDQYNIRFIYQNIEYTLSGYDDITLEELKEIARQLN